jgi:AcrR family transcriptional regulator
MPAIEDTQPVDGRSARAVRTRNAIVDACISLADEGDLKPTTPRIAERAGVSVRSVFQHFEGLEQLYAAVADRVVERVAKLIVPLDTTLPLDDRITEFVRQRTLLVEVITPIRRAAAVHGPFSEELTNRVRNGQRFFRAFTRDAFAPELDQLGEADAEEMLDILDVMFGWPTWEMLRMFNGRSVDEATRTITKMVDGAFVLAGFDPS